MATGTGLVERGQPLDPVATGGQPRVIAAGRRSRRASGVGLSPHPIPASRAIRKAEIGVAVPGRGSNPPKCRLIGDERTSHCHPTVVSWAQ